ncbi:MAG: Cro/Cl family transcriptional regulator [Pseudomonadales bacterium]|nr:Cro/Cl family transcriptional regulator [Pseudomonadales bacterium]
MSEITLTQYLKICSQREVAEALGLTQGAVSQMVRAGRDIRLLIDDAGALTGYYEIKAVRRAVRRVHERDGAEHG